jgi:hypothetical protein
MTEEIIQKAKDGSIRIIYIGVGEATAGTVSELISRSKTEEGFSFEYKHAEDYKGLQGVVDKIVKDAVAANSEILIDLDLPGKLPSNIKVFDETGKVLVSKDMDDPRGSVQADANAQMTKLNNQGFLRIQNGQITGRLDVKDAQGSPVNINDYELVRGFFESKQNIGLTQASEEDAIFVIDDSGTMREDRVSGSDKTKIAVVNELLPGIQSLFKSTDEPIKFGEGGGTPGWGAMNQVLNKLKDIKQNKGNLPNRVFVITDGLFNDAPLSTAALIELADFCFKNNIKFSILGIGSDFTSFQDGLKRESAMEKNIRQGTKFLAPTMTSIQRLFELSAATRGVFVAVDADNIKAGFDQLRADISGWAKVPGADLNSVRILLKNKNTGNYLEVDSKIFMDDNFDGQVPLIPSGGLEDNSSSDHAEQTSENDKAALMTKGGIDLDPGLIEMRRQGAMTLDWSLSAKQFENIAINGLVPVVNQMIPVSAADLTFLMGRD